MTADRTRRTGSGLPRWLAVLLAVLTVSVVPVVDAPPAQAAPYLPPGFAVQDMPSGQRELLTDFAFAPDGSWFTTGKNGRVAWVSADGTVVRTLAELSVVTTQDLGLTGLALAPDFDRSRVLYLTRTVAVGDRWVMRLAARTVTVDTAGRPTGLGTERVIWDLPGDVAVHAMTAVVAAPDGTLWVTIGDAADYRSVDVLALRAQDPDVGYGKVLHVHPDGRGVEDNPRFDPAAPSSWRSRVYASGFRSPFRMSLDPTTGTPVVGDVGWRTWEEVDLVRPGGNYGWPCWEGDVPTPGYSDLTACRGVANDAPLHDYVHGPAGTSISGGIVYTGSTYPEQYRGAYFFGDYSSRRVYTLRYDSAGTLTRPAEPDGFGRDNGAPVAFRAAPNGDVVYADIAGAVLKRIVYLPGNRPPSARVTTTTDPATRTVTFDGSASSDLDGDALVHSWDFGDGTTGTGARVSHTYAAPGTQPLTARLTVTDAKGAQGSATVTVVPANASPVISLQAPADDRRFRVGETVAATATATDPEDGDLPVTWRVLLVHCGGGYCHDHPGESLAGPRFDVPFEDHGDDTTLYVTAEATDSLGGRAQARFVARPLLRTLTVSADTPAAVVVDGVARATATIAVGARVSVVAPVRSADGGATFLRWADGQPRERTLTMPDADVSLQAEYLSAIAERRASDPRVAFLGAPAGPEIATAGVRYQAYQAGRMYWSAAAGVHEVHGGNLRVYLAAGGSAVLGEPLTDETPTADGVGRYNDFAGASRASTYYSPATGSVLVLGGIGRLWRSMGAERSVHGYPRTNEAATPDGRGRFSSFQDGGIYYLPSRGSSSVHGGIYQRWAALGLERGVLGFPLTSERATADGAGRYNHFEKGSVFWTRRTGAHEVRGGIRTRWSALGWERSYLGYPISGEYAVPGGRRSDFERGYIRWDAATGRVVDRRY